MPLPCSFRHHGYYCQFYLAHFALSLSLWHSWFYLRMGFSHTPMALLQSSKALGKAPWWISMTSNLWLEEFGVGGFFDPLQVSGLVRALHMWIHPCIQTWFCHGLILPRKALFSIHKWILTIHVFLTKINETFHYKSILLRPLNIVIFCQGWQYLPQVNTHTWLSWYTAQMFPRLVTN